MFQAFVIIRRPNIDGQAAGIVRLKLREAKLAGEMMTLALDSFPSDVQYPELTTTTRLVNESRTLHQSDDYAAPTRCPQAPKSACLAVNTKSTEHCSRSLRNIECMSMSEVRIWVVRAMMSFIDHVLPRRKRAWSPLHLDRPPHQLSATPQHLVSSQLGATWSPPSDPRASVK
jgi:hypothetical protein